MFFALFDAMQKQFANQFVLISMTGGSAPNVIPRAGVAQIAVDNAVLDNVITFINTTMQQHFVEQYAIAETGKKDLTEAKAECKLAVVATAAGVADENIKVLNQAAIEDAIAIGLKIKSGVLAYNPDIPTFVDTSNCFSLLKLDEKELLFHTFARSGIDAALNEYYEELKQIATQHNAQISEKLNPFPGWPVLATSELLTVAKQSFETAFGRPLPEENIYSIHAGLECGCLAPRIPKTHMISVGPTILDAHSPSERCHIPAVGECSKWIINMLKKLAELDAAKL
eukprot:UN02528